MTKTIQVRFENQHDDYVGVLSNSPITFSGKLASQNAGSSNPGIYYQVGGGGVNGRFSGAFGAEVSKINAALVELYDAKYGDGAWKQDQQPGSEIPLTSFFVPVDPSKGTSVAADVAGMVYSVGPVLSKKGITDRQQYEDIYRDALLAVAQANQKQTGIHAVRITMLSTGIYGSMVSDPRLLYNTSAELILSGIEVAASNCSAENFPSLILVNSQVDSSGHGKEVDAFTHAAKDRNLNMNHDGFDFPVSTKATSPE